MDAIDLRALLLLQRFGGADIGLDHHLFDEAHGFQTLAEGDGFHLAVFADDDAPFRKIEIEG